MKSISIQVFGKVQGVWYRASTRHKAIELGLWGTVQNQKDGSVYIEATGHEQQLQNLITWCQEGPPHARVDRLEKKEIKQKTFSSFEIIR